MITQDSVVINGDLAAVYGRAQDLERQHEFIPGYLPARVTRTGNETIIERMALIDGATLQWKSLVWFDENRSLRFEQIEGRLKGMKIEWRFEEVPGGTRVTIIHDVHLPIPLVGFLIERWMAKPSIDRLTAGVLAGLKKMIEGK